MPYDRVLLKDGTLAEIVVEDYDRVCAACGGQKPCSLLVVDMDDGTPYFPNEVAYYLDIGEEVTAEVLEDAYGDDWKEKFNA